MLAIWFVFIGAVILGISLMVEGYAAAGLFWFIALGAAIALGLPHSVLALCILGGVVAWLRRDLFNGQRQQSLTDDWLGFMGV